MVKVQVYFLVASINLQEEVFKMSVKYKLKQTVLKLKDLHSETSANVP